MGKQFKRGQEETSRQLADLKDKMDKCRGLTRAQVQKLINGARKKVDVLTEEDVKGIDFTASNANTAGRPIPNTAIQNGPVIKSKGADMLLKNVTVTSDYNCVTGALKSTLIMDHGSYTADAKLDIASVLHISDAAVNIAGAKMDTKGKVVSRSAALPGSLSGTAIVNGTPVVY